MGWVLEIKEAAYQRLREHLRGEVEDVAFLFTEPYADDQRLRVRDLQLISSDGFNTQGGYHVELADEIRPALIKRAWDEDACVIEAHSHLHGPARFSASDHSGLAEWVPHLRWRLRGRPYAALVFAPEGFDALIWDGASSPKSIEAIEVIGGPTLTPTNYTLSPPSITTTRKGAKKTSWWRRILGR